MARVSYVMTSVVLRQKLVIMSNAEALLLAQLLHMYCAACEFSVYLAVGQDVLRTLLKVSVISIALQSDDAVQPCIRRFCVPAAGLLLLLCSIRAQQ